MVTAKLLDKFQSPKIIFLPSDLDLDDVPRVFNGRVADSLWQETEARRPSG